jgi:hypothetical protein
VLGAQLEEVEARRPDVVAALGSGRHGERLDGVDPERLDDRAEGCVVHAPQIGRMPLSLEWLSRTDSEWLPFKRDPIGWIGWQTQSWCPRGGGGARGGSWGVGYAPDV